MKTLPVLVFAVAIALGTTSASAQDIRLQVEVSRDASDVAKTVLRVRSGGEGKIVINSDAAPNIPFLAGLRENIALTPTVQGENASIAFEIMSNGKQFRPSLVISKDIKGSFEWISTEGQTIRLTVSWAN